MTLLSIVLKQKRDRNVWWDSRRNSLLEKRIFQQNIAQILGKFFVKFVFPPVRPGLGKMLYFGIN